MNFQRHKISSLAGIYQLGEDGVIRAFTPSDTSLELSFIGQAIDTLFPDIVTVLQSQSSFGQGLSTSAVHSFYTKVKDNQSLGYVSYATRLSEGGYQLVVLEDDAGWMAHWQKLQKTNSINQALYDSSLDALITVDESSIIHGFSPSAEKVFGYRIDEVMGGYAPDLIIPPERRSAHIAGVTNYVKTGIGLAVNARMEVEAMRKNGEVFPCEITVVPTQRIKGERYFTATLRDLTEQKLSEQRLLDALQAAEQGNAAKSRFLTHMSHEIRSPLNAIIGTLELISDKPRNQEEQVLASTALSASQSLIRMIDDILEFSRIESGRREITKNTFNLYHLCNQVVELASITASHKSLVLCLYIDSDVSEIVEGDQCSIRQVLVSLVDNAIKYSKQGVIGITLSCIENVISFSIEDEGIGINEQDQLSILSAFTRGEALASDSYSGTGLGLAICGKLLINMDSDIHVHSELNKGSVFSFKLKLPRVAPLTVLNEITQKGPLILVTSNAVLPRYIASQAKQLGYVLQLQTPETMVFDEESNCPILIDLVCKTSTSILIEKLGKLNEQSNIILLVNSKSPLGLIEQFQTYIPPITLQHLDDCLNQQQNPSGETSLNTNQSQFEKDLFFDKRILIVEDNPANQLVAKSILSRLNVKFDLVDNGAEAVEKVKAEHYDIVLMDVRMPVMDGLQATKAIRKLDISASSLPILAMTANVFAEDVEQCLRAGMNDFIAKPVSSAILKKKLWQWLEREKQAVSDGDSNATIELKNSELTTSPSQVIDLNTLRQLIDDTDSETVVSILHVYKQQLTDLQAMLSSLDCSDTDQVNQLAEVSHNIKSASGYCGAKSLQELAAELEKACRYNTIQPESNCLQLLPEVINATIAEIDRIDIADL